VAAKSNARSGTLPICLLAIAYSLACAPAYAQSAKPEPQQKKVVLRIRNGKTGWPIWAELPNVWIGGAKSPLDPPPKTDWRGEIKLEAPADGPHEIRLTPNWYIDCRIPSEVTAGRNLKYSIDQILKDGVVSENLCGEPRAKPVPGVIILYVRPRTWKEIMEL
jgi:hypothetical protein